MRVIVDSCAGRRIAEHLLRSGIEAIFVGDWPEDPGDDQILGRAIREQRVVVTRDKDFGDLVVVGQVAHFGIVRLVDLSVRAAPSMCLAALKTYESELAAGAIVVVEPTRIRIRRPS